MNNYYIYTLLQIKIAEFPDWYLNFKYLKKYIIFFDNCSLYNIQ